MRSPDLLLSLVVLALPAAMGSFAVDTRSALAYRGRGVLICHHAGPNHMKTLRVGESAVPNHVQSHNDYVGACGPHDGGDDDTDS